MTRQQTYGMGVAVDVASRAELERRLVELERDFKAQQRMLDQAVGQDGRGGELGQRVAGLEASRDKLGQRLGQNERATESLRRWRASVVAIGAVALMVLGAVLKEIVARLMGGG